ncbi:UvrD-helicase domain-containing protein [Siminovitchia fordii]|nr:UvrD-helicase domain-containing protein [Siminovitchia fordii]
MEHGSTDGHTIVQAGAGTGKTTVMIDRFLFLKKTLLINSLEALKKE